MSVPCQCCGIWQSVPASACRKTRTAKRRGKRFIAEFARRLREARPGERVYMRVGDVFKDADIYSLDEWRAARWAAVFGDDDGREDTGR